MAVSLRENDELIKVELTQNGNDVIIGTKNGKVIRFSEEQIRSMGRSAQGVRAVKLALDDEVVGMEVIKEDATLLTVTENGFGKRTDPFQYRPQRRGGMGIIGSKITSRSGRLVSIYSVDEDDELMIISEQGMVIRFPAKDIPIVGRTAVGVKLIKLRKDDKVVAVDKIAKEKVD
jgi:DNA gyrase subunit A